jgi:hypothetical protein
MGLRETKTAAKPQREKVFVPKTKMISPNVQTTATIPTQAYATYR